MLGYMKAGHCGVSGVQRTFLELLLRIDGLVVVVLVVVLFLLLLLVAAVFAVVRRLAILLGVIILRLRVVARSLQDLFVSS